jgi:hypothetical protein
MPRKSGPFELEGVRQALDFMKFWPKEVGRESVSHNNIGKVAERALEPARADAKRIALRHAKGTDAGFSKMAAVGDGVRVKKIAKRHNVPGATMRISGNDVPMTGGSGSGMWNIQGVAKLLGFGNHKDTTQRQGHGDVDGIGNFLAAGIAKNKGRIKGAFRSGIIKEAERVKKKIIRRLNNGK